MKNKIVEKPKFDPATELLYLIIRKRATLDSLLHSEPLEYIAAMRRGIDGGCGLLRWLKLVKPNKKSVLGWTPTRRLLQLIVASQCGPKISKREYDEVDEE